MARGFGYVPAPPKLTTSTVPPANGFGIIQGGQVGVGAQAVNWIHTTAQEKGTLNLPGIQAGIAVSEFWTSEAAPLTGPAAASFAPTMAPASDVSAANPSGLPYLYSTTPYDNFYYTSGVAFPLHLTPGWTMQYEGYDLWYLLDPSGDSVVATGGAAIAWTGTELFGTDGVMENLMNIGAFLIGQDGSTVGVTMLGLNSGDYPATANSWTETLLAYDENRIEPTPGGTPPPTVPLLGVIPFVGWYGVDEMPSGTTNMYLDNLSWGPVYGTAGETSVEPCIAQGVLGILSVPAANFTNSFPATPSSGTATANNIVYLDLVNGTYGYATGTSTTGTAQDPGLPGISAPVARVVLSTTSAGVQSSTVTDLRQFVGTIGG